MTPPSILSSPFFTHSVLDTLLSQPMPISERIQLLSAKIHLYANPPIDQDSGVSPGEESHQGSRSANRSRKDEARIPEMRTRLELAIAEKDQLIPGGASQAENTLRIVLEWSKGVMKGIERRQRLEEQGTIEKCANGSGEAESGIGWIKEGMEIRKKALVMLIELQDGSGGTSRKEALRRQLIEVDAAGFG